MTIAPLLFWTAFQAAPQEEKAFALMVGDRAPAIAVAEWVQGAPVTSFQPGQNYVVEFWATWCGPCKVAIPHLNELQHKYKDSVRFVGVSVWEEISEKEPYSVPDFVRSMGDKMTYTVASDRVRPDDPPHMASKWLDDAGQNGIPTAFIVNKEGRVAWIGHPMGIDGPLADVVAGTWDVEAAAKKYSLEAANKVIGKKLAQEITKAKKSKDYAAALRVIDETLAKYPALEENYGVEKYFLLLEAERLGDAATYGQHLVSDVLASNAMALNKLSWSIVDPNGKWKTGDYELALRAAERAVALLEERDAAVLDTLGLALFKVGKVDQAIEKQAKAVELSKGTKLEGELRSRLEEFRAAKAKKGGV